MAKFIVHIGDGKCGSSAMQAAMFDARAQMMNHGLLYTSHHRTSGNFCLGTLLGKATRGLATAQQKFAQDTVRKLQDDIESCDYVIISSEDFLTFDPEEVVEILQMITLDIESIDAIAYIRDPLGQYLSRAQQSIKASYRFQRPDTFIRPVDRWLSHWESFPMISSLTVRHFDRGQLVGGNAVADFEHVVKGLTGKDFSLEHINENSSLSAEQMVVLQDYRSQFCRQIEGKLAPGSSRLIDFFTTMNEDGLIGSKPQLSKDAAARVATGNAAIVERLNSKFGFTLDCPMPPEDHELEAKENWNRIADILIDVQPHFVHHLKMLIPAFNPALSAGDMTKGLKSMNKLSELEPLKRQAIERATKIYWTTESIAGLTEGA